MKYKTIKAAYAAGYRKGCIKGVELGYAQAKARFHAANYNTLAPTPTVSPEEALRRTKETNRVNALRDICQAGTAVTECMTKALLSIDNNL